MIKDAGRIAALLGIVEKVTTVSPGMTHIISEAMAELRLLNEGIRKEHLAEANKPVTPAAVGDPESPQAAIEPPEGGDPKPGSPVATKPTEKKIDTDTKPPPVTKPADTPPEPPKNNSPKSIPATSFPEPVHDEPTTIDRRV